MIDLLIVFIVILAVILIFTEILTNVFSETDRENTEIEYLESSVLIKPMSENIFFPGDLIYSNLNI